MGKNLKGKELGTGISQRKDGYYVARFSDKYGKRQQKIFKNLQECKKWLNDGIEYDQHSNMNVPFAINLETWFDYWAEIKSPKLKKNTIKNYTNIYNSYIKPELGKCVLSQIKPMQCQNILNMMARKGFKSSYIRQVKDVLYQIFEYAYKNDVIYTNPCKALESNIGQPSEEKKVLDLNTQKEFLFAIRKRECEYPCRFVLQTGLRSGELIGLKWEDIDFKNKTITVSRTIDIDKDVGTPKTEAGFRKIPLTDEAICILTLQREKNARLKMVDIRYSEYIFLNSKGKLSATPNYDVALDRICKKFDLMHISMHTLRHTFATRCIEAGMKPKVLQTIMGHSSLAITMNLYVHITDDEKYKEMEAVSSYLKLVGT